MKGKDKSGPRERTHNEGLPCIELNSGESTSSSQYFMLVFPEPHTHDH